MTHRIPEAVVESDQKRLKPENLAVLLLFVALRWDFLIRTAILWFSPVAMYSGARRRAWEKPKFLLQMTNKNTELTYVS